MNQMSQREHQLDKSLLVSFELPESFDLHQSASRVEIGNGLKIVEDC